jgi:uncharacterized protein
MDSTPIDIKKHDEACQVHGTPSKAAHRALWGMVLASLLLIVWHVWVYGPTGHAKPDALPGSFPVLLGHELWDLLFDGHGIVAELWDIFPYFIAGILLAGYIRTYKIAVKLQAKFRKHGLLSVLIASLVGMITPLCACGTLTTAVSLLFAGMPLAPVMALLVTSPLLSPTTYLLTLNDLGPEWTVIRTVAAFAMGMFAGTVTLLLRDRGFDTKSIFIEGAIPRGDFHDEAYPDERLRCNCKERFGHRVAARTNNMFLVFLAKSSEMLWMVGKYVLVGVAIGAVVERYMPYEWIYRLFGQKDPLSIVWVTLGSVPVFLHQISASSILYHIKSSLHGTLDGGAGLAFMIGGPVTAIPTMIMFWTIFKKRVFFLYLFVCLAGTILIAYSFQFLVFVPGVDSGNPLFREVRSLSGGSAAVITKKDQHVRIAMDPDGKSMIATYTNEQAGQGGVVLDGGFERFLDASADRYDNRTYVANVADWLEEGNTSAARKSVLVYDTFSQAGIGREIFSKGIRAVLESKGFNVRITGRRESPVVSGKLLEAYGQVWMMTGGSGADGRFSPPELDALARFSEDGKGMLIVTGPQDQTAANQLAARYGVAFTGSAENKDELPVSTASHFLNRASEALRSFLKLVHKA